jgi:hemoglobin
MYTFWQTVLLGEHTYFGSPFPPHANLPISHNHFERWMQLFNQTLDELFTGEKAEEAKWRAAKMAEIFESKIEYYKNTILKGLV